jgi:hypothetical protein
MPVFFDVDRLAEDWEGVDASRYPDGIIPTDEQRVIMECFPELELGSYLDPPDQEYWFPVYNPIKHICLPDAMTFCFRKPIGPGNYYLPPIYAENQNPDIERDGEPPRLRIGLTLARQFEEWLGHDLRYAYRMEWLSAQDALERIDYFAPDPYSMSLGDWRHAMHAFKQAFLPQPYRALRRVLSSVGWEWDPAKGEKWRHAPEEFRAPALIAAVAELESHLTPEQRRGGIGFPWEPLETPPVFWWPEWNIETVTAKRKAAIESARIAAGGSALDGLQSRSRR